MRKPGFPRQSYDEKKLIKQLEKEYPPSLVDKYYAATNEPDRRAIRDKIINGRLSLMNLHYNQFVSHFSVTKQTLDTTADITELGLNLATTAVGGATTKTVLGAVSAGVTGSKLAIDKNFFFEKTVPVLVSSMNAQRKQTLLPIMTGIGRSTDEYPLTQALSDLDAYYFAGTFVGALQAMQADAGVKENKAEISISQIRNAAFVTTNIQSRIDVLLDRIGKLPDAAAIELEKKPPVKDAEVDKIVALRDPTNQRFEKGDVARQMLKMRAVLSGKRNDQELVVWEAAVKSVQ
jgi:hypothetical protein